MDLKELSESVQQQTAPVPLISPKRQIRSRFQLNLDKTIESCKAQLGTCFGLLAQVLLVSTVTVDSLYGVTARTKPKLDPGCCWQLLDLGPVCATEE